MNELQKRTAQAMVNIFETGSARGDYGRVTVVRGDAGHLTYGRAQASLASGNLYRLVQAYCSDASAVYGAELRAYLDRLRGRDFSLDNDATLRVLLEEAGSDPVMRARQDEFFDGMFFEPAMEAADACGLAKPLSRAVVYDSFIQGSWETVRRRTAAALGTGAARAGEDRWVASYVDTRRRWLASRGGALAKTTYRMDAFRDLISQEKWELELPLMVRGVRIDRDTLQGRPAWRTLRLTAPRMTGQDVEDLQRGLAAAGYDCACDGEFGPETEAALKRFQTARGLEADGVAGRKTRDALPVPV